ncbi:winged helix-turn-helix domain-containing protein [Bowmanella denitrificans]|uniref:winged helix-turn-helix domain-containing protein n=1 Tax=Bowmanella denitrificans TaxID=366582 RepID=UPI001559DB5A|nr:winged helix-turn-helix domain-containing protein [Bowmanella denitrificans]
MAKQYWVGEFLVDLSRNQISQQDRVQTLPPKALQVLTYLAQHSGRVVSHDELLDKVWANAVVTPNTLQRSIAQLRKAFGESSKASALIKTHAKQGYSLEGEVRWSEEISIAEENRDAVSPAPQLNDSAQQESVQTRDKREFAQPCNPSDIGISSPKLANSNMAYWLLAATAILVLAIGLIPFVSDSPELKLGDLRYLTATDDKEYGATYTPDGQYIIFHRYYEKVCSNNLWAKHAQTMQEIQLTAKEGTYAGHSLSADGKRLIFIEEQDCTAPLRQPTCYKLMSLDFQAALTEPQQPSELLNCQHSEIRDPLWMDAQHIVLLQRDDRLWRLVRYSLADHSSDILYEVKDGLILTFTWSAERQRLAVTLVKADGVQYIEMLHADGRVISSHPIQFPPDAPRHLKVAPEFIPGQAEMLLAYRGQLYMLSEQGQVTKLNLALEASVGSPAFHPDGQRLLLISGRYDSDVARLSVADNVNAQQQAIAPAVFERSINHEDNAKFQPGGEQIAFVSKRTGTEQVWLSGDEGSRLVSDFPKGTFISSLFWDNDGQGLLVLADMDIYKLSLNNQHSRQGFPYPIFDLFAWNSDSQQLLARILVNGMVQLVTIDLGSMDYQTVTNKKVIWAAKDPQEPLIYMDHLKQFWLQGGIEDKLIDSLLGQGSEKGFVLQDGQLYGINKANQLWRYHIQADTFSVVAPITPDIDYLTDIQGQELLATLLVAERKEVIELTFAN